MVKKLDFEQKIRNSQMSYIFKWWSEYHILELFEVFRSYYEHIRAIGGRGLFWCKRKIQAEIAFGGPKSQNEQNTWF